MRKEKCIEARSDDLLPIEYYHVVFTIPPVRVMSALFRGKFLDLLKSRFKRGEITFPGSISHLNQPGNFKIFRNKLYHKKCVVYCKQPFDGAKGVPQYLVRYTHRIAISNNRILIASCREFLGTVKTLTKEKRQEIWQEQLLRICGIDVSTCPVCQKGRMFRTALLLPYRCISPPELRR